ncbi:hypothetical protein MIMGU_mgv1a020826mg [Erythranthe guttata]|uniref:NPH3 domain-containing protein n=2 Tax=Erythranthe guttata TaxID=4155 RepID=A0A022QDU3_ERYGU|nr:hypothetical protein MIMGU_mgv1a020826mg [Erythranthe guttata]
MSEIDDCISDMDYFIKTLSSLKDKAIRPDQISSIITHCATKWLPELALDQQLEPVATTTPKHDAVSLTKKRLFIETLIGILPPEKEYYINNIIPCNFLLRLLRVANTSRAGPVYVSELEKRVSLQLDRTSLKELRLLFDFGLVLRLVRGFVSAGGDAAGGKVAVLVDSYLAEAASDDGSCVVAVSAFVELATAIPGHARLMDDGLYRAVDMYLKAHPEVSKQDRKTLCNLIDTNKLSQEASLHASRNERVPVRAAFQILLSEQTKLKSHFIEWSGSMSWGPHSPARYSSNRETGPSWIEIERLKEDVVSIQSRCMAMEMQIEKMKEEKKTKKRGLSYLMSWKKNLVGVNNPGFNKDIIIEDQEIEAGSRINVRGRTHTYRRKSLS